MRTSISLASLLATATAITALPPAARADDPALGATTFTTYEGWMSPQQQPGEESETPKLLEKSLGATAPSTPREQRKSRGWGRIRFTKDLTKAIVDIQIAGVNPADIIMFHIHCGPPGGLGPIVVDFGKYGALPTQLASGKMSVEVKDSDITYVSMFPKGFKFGLPESCPAEPGWPIQVKTVAGLEALARQGVLYFNLHTKAHTFYGEMRGQILRALTRAYALGVRATATAMMFVLAVACGGAAPRATAPTTPTGPTTPTAPTSAPVQPTATVVLARPLAGGSDTASERDAAIAKLEAFIAAHPDDQTYVPDALLRLGSLQLDGADDELARLADAPGDAAAKAAMKSATAAAITALARLTDGYPAYPRRDLALYLLGYARQQAGDVAGAVTAYGAVAALPASTLADEARFRVGELHFDAGVLDLAAADYAPLAQGTGKLAALAGYKLGWTQYRRGAYPAAIAGFQGLLDRADSEPMVAELRVEAAEYVAECLTEADWDGDGKDDPAPRGAPTASVARVAGYLGDGASPVRRDVAERAAEALTDEARFSEATAVYRALLAKPVDDATRARLEAALAHVNALAR